MKCHRAKGREGGYRVTGGWPRTSSVRIHIWINGKEHSRQGRLLCKCPVAEHGGHVGEHQGGQCGWNLTFTGREARNKIQEEQRARPYRTLLPKHMPFQVQKDQTFTKFSFTQNSPVVFLEEFMSPYFKWTTCPHPPKKVILQANIFTWGKTLSSINKNENYLWFCMQASIHGAGTRHHNREYSPASWATGRAMML